MIDKTPQSAHSRTFYRSFRYKVSPQACQSTLMSSVLMSNKESKKLSTSHLRAKSLFVRKESVPKIENQQEHIKKKPSYLDTWGALMSPLAKMDSSPEKVKTGRVCLPNIADFQPSYFTSLDPLFIPFDYLQKAIKDVKMQLPLPKRDMAQIKAQMKSFHNKIVNELKDIQQTGMSGFEKLHKMLRNDSVLYQQNRMRFKRQFAELENADNIFKEDFEATKPRLSVMQIDLFSCKPFDLERDQQLEQQFPQTYF